MAQDSTGTEGGGSWPMLPSGGDAEDDEVLAELSAAEDVVSVPLLMGESWPVWAKPMMDDALTDDDDSDAIHGDCGRPRD